MNVSDAIRTKRAVREFLPNQIPPELVSLILHAGRRAQSSKNEQPWSFVAVQQTSILEKLASCGPWAGHLAGSALGIAIVTTDPAAKFQTMFDAGQAAAYMQLAAWEYGIGSCLATIYEEDRARAILRFPEELHLRIMISFGYPVASEKLTAPPRAGGRRSLAEVVHYDQW